MKLTDLTSPYRELAEMRHEQKPHPSYDEHFTKDNDLVFAFVWDETNEREDFWVNVNRDFSPPIPQSSHFELAAWKLQKRVDNLEPELKDVLKSQLKDPTAIIESPDHRLFTAAVAAMQGLLSNPNLKSEMINDRDEKMLGFIAETAVKQAKALLTEIDKK